MSTLLSPGQCQRLRDMGYPQGDCDYYYLRRGDDWFHGDVRGPGGYDEMVGCPDLQELIEWLGKGFSELALTFQNDWVAVAYREGKEYRTGGTTPLKAVYKLALAVKGGQDISVFDGFQFDLREYWIPGQRLNQPKRSAMNADELRERLSQLYDYATGLSAWNVEDRRAEWLLGMERIIEAEKEASRMEGAHALGKWMMVIYSEKGKLLPGNMTIKDIIDRALVEMAAPGGEGTHEKE